MGNVFDTFYRVAEGISTTIANKDNEEDEVDYESRDVSGSDYSNSIEEEEEEEEEDDVSESDYDEDRRRRKREIFMAETTQKLPEEKLNILRRIFSLFKIFFTSLFRVVGKSEKDEKHNYKHVEGRLSGKANHLSKRSKREIAPPQLPSRRLNRTHDVITQRSMPGDFFEMITHMFSPTSTKKEAPITLISHEPITKKKYHNFQLWRIKTSKMSDITYLDELRMSVEGKKLHWLEKPRTHSFTDIVVAPEHLKSFEKYLTKGEINFSVKLRNIQNAIRFENLRMNRKEQLEAEIINGHPLTFYRYHPSKDIVAYYDFIKRKYPSFVELITLGYTFNSKPLTIVKVSSPKQEISTPDKPGVFILAGLSAHLYLPVASSLYILNTIVTNLANNDSLGEYFRKFDWYVLSLLNVDGYDYSMAFDRLWRKTRSAYSSGDSNESSP